MHCRTKLNLSPEHPISSDDILSKHARRKEDLERTLKNLADLEEEKISLQIKLGQKNKCLRRLCSYVNDMGLKIPERFISLFLDEEINESQAFETLKNSISKPIVNNNITMFVCFFILFNMLIISFKNY